MAVLAASLAAWAAPAAGAASLTEKDGLESALVSRINTVRASRGLRKLRVIPRLANAGERHARSMGGASYFRHELYTPSLPVDWTSFGRWIRWYYPGPGYRSWSAGENLAWGAPDLTARQAVSRWLASPGHRANLLAPRWRNLGVAAVHVLNPSGYFGGWGDVTIVVAEFGRRSS